MQNNNYNINILAACNRKLGSLLAGAGIFVGVFMGLAMGVLASSPAWAQGTPPAASANCTVTAMNRTAPLQGDYGFTIYNIPGASNPFMAVVKEDDLAIMTAWFATLFFKCR